MTNDHALEEQVAAGLPDWIARRPLLRARLRELVAGESPSGVILPPMSFEAFLSWVDEDTWAEWVDGKVIVMSPAGLRHQDVSTFLSAVMRAYVDHHHLGRVLSAPFLVKLGRSARQPDILFVSTDNADRLSEAYLDGPPDLAVEILSPESVGRDRGDKYLEYEAAGVPEYWLIDPRRATAEFYRLDAQGRYQPVGPDESGSYHAAVVPGFRLHVAWLWQDPLPPVLEVLRSIGVG